MNITNRTTHNVQQGSPGWLALRTGYPTASEAPATQGVSRYMTRSELLRQKATGITPEHDDRTLARFAEGHRVEAQARPLAEEYLGEELSNVTMTAVVDGLPLLASLDGINFDGDISWECKLWNEDLAEQVRTNNLHPMYTVQMDQQQLVSGAKRTLFTCSDGTPERTVHCWYESTKEKQAALLVHWRQFLQENEAYVPEVAKPETIGHAPEALPALRIEVQGAVTESNLDNFKVRALTVIRSIKTELQTDADFADAEKTVKWCEEVESRLTAAKDHALSQTESIDHLFRTIDEISEEARQVRLKLSKLVKSEKEARKEQIVLQAEKAFDQHIGALERRLEALDNHPCRFPAVHADFAGAVKGLKSLDSMRDKVAVTLTNAKHEANQLADKLEANRKHLVQEDGDWIALFADFATAGTKAPEDFQILAALRIGNHKQAEAQRLEAQRLEAQREQIRKEEEAKAQCEAKARADAEAAEQARLLDAERARIRAKEQAAAQQAQAVIQAASATQTEAVSPQQALVSAATVAINQAQSGQAAHLGVAKAEGETLTLGQINTILAPIKVDAAGLEQMGFEARKVEKSVAKHYAANDLPKMLCAMVQHLQGVLATA